MRTIPDFIEVLLKHGIEVALTCDGFQVGGFYKSGDVRLVPNGDDWVAHARYNEETEIQSLEDLVSLNYDWWQRSKGRYEGWAQPDSKWAPLLVEFGYVKAVEVPATVRYE